MDFGQQVLSHPLLVEAIETEFVPVAVYNNKPGPDKKILARYKEPAWNNPVVRFLGADGKDVIPRQDGVYTVGKVADRMVRVLRSAKRSVPGYLALLAREAQPRSFVKASFAMF